MNSQALDSFLGSVYKVTRLPILCHTCNGDVTLYHPYFAESDTDAFSSQAAALYSSLRTNHPGKTAIYKIHPGLILTGIVAGSTPNEYVFFGPAAASSATAEGIRDYLFEAGLSPEATAQYAGYLLQTAGWSSGSFRDVMTMVAPAISGLALSDENIPEVSGGDNISRILAAHKAFYAAEPDKSEADRSAVTDYSNRLAGIMLAGDVDTLSKMLGDISTIFSGKEYESDLEEERLSSYASIFGYEKLAVYANVLPDTSETLKQYYLHRMQLAASVEELRRCSVEAMYDFTRMLGENKNTATDNPTVNRAMAYIDENIQRKLSVADIANAVHAGEHYLYIHFKEASGRTIMEYVNEQKVKKACHYMLFTDRSLAEIANFLSFSSQSYFQTVFKNVTGMTPKEWKKAQNVI